MLTRTEIIADVMAKRLPPRHTAVMIALFEFQSALPVDQLCPECKQLLNAVGLPEGAKSPRAWAVRCQCGESVFRGL
jgi:hypothetical protein